MTSRRRELPIEDSWRVVDGENDSFDTSILPSLASDDSGPLAPPSSGQPSSGLPSQLSSQGNASLASQDSIRDFERQAESDQNLLLEPFRPSMPGSRITARHDNRTPDPVFKMPTMGGYANDRRSAGRREYRADHDDGVRRRAKPTTGSPLKKRATRRRAYDDDDDEDEDDVPTTINDRLADSVPPALYNVLSWAFGVVALAFRYIQRPLALLLAVYLFFGGLIITQNMITKSVFASLSPVCRVPGVSYLHLPFCPNISPEGDGPIEFDDLMSVQSKFEEVMEKSVEGVSLPIMMKRSEMDIRDLRTMVRHSELKSKDELSLEFDGYIDTVRYMSSDLQRFNVHVGGAVDSVISINRWTSRYIDSLAPSSSDADPSALSEWTSWFFYPFTPPEEGFSERAVLNQYIEHTALVSSRISSLILEAQSVLRQLNKAEDHLSVIHDITARTSASISGTRGDILYTLWNIVSANREEARSHKKQVNLLKRVESQRSSAVAQVSTLILDLETIQAGLSELRDRVSGPQLLSSIPLSVHIETINLGIERLEDARSRIRATENDKIQEALSRGGVERENLIDG